MVVAAWGDAPPIVLSCHGETNTDEAVVTELCAVLEAELSEREPSRMVQRRVRSEPHPAGARDVVLEVLRTEPHSWEGRLTWGVAGQKSGAGRTTGPPVEIWGMDAPLGPSAYRQFIRGLLKVSYPVF